VVVVVSPTVTVSSGSAFTVYEGLVIDACMEEKTKSSKKSSGIQVQSQVQLVDEVGMECSNLKEI
jgi:hypothetical protein